MLPKKLDWVVALAMGCLGYSLSLSLLLKANAKANDMQIHFGK